MLYAQVVVAIALGGALGYFLPSAGERLQPMGDLFIRLVKMVIAPVIFLTVAPGIAEMSDLKNVGRTAFKALLYFFVVSTLALVIGVAVANLARPGAGMNVDPASLSASSVAAYVSQAHHASILSFVMGVVPDTLLSAFVKGDILQVLLVSVLFGVALALAGEKGEPLLAVMKSASATVFRLVGLVLRAAPLGAFGAVAFTIAKYGLAALAHLAALVAAFYGAAALFVLVVLGAIGLLHGFSILSLLRYIGRELFLVLGTSSSEAALPSLMEKLERAGCPRSIVGLVTPLGYSFNLDGTNIYLTLAALFIAQATGIELSLSDQLTVFAVAMLSSKGAAGVTGAGFVTLAATLSVVHSIPVAGMALILGVDRFMSECRALTNVIGNAVATIVVSRWQGALDRVQLREALGGRRRTAKVEPSRPAVDGATANEWGEA